MADDKVITFAYTPEGHGGTFPFDPIRSPPLIGTYGLTTSVGVYLPLPDDRSFIAHINAGIKTKLDLKIYRLNFAESTAIKNAVHEQLTAHAKANDWSPQDVISTANANGSKRPYVMCPMYCIPSNPNQGIVDGIQHFLGSAGNVDLHINEHMVQGFYVEVRTGSVQTIEQKWDLDWRGQRVESGVGVGDKEGLVV
ncbi:hypothetical protein PRZ48_000050 [Zasmidium cellare]|uniref:Uncharacterized protein n=1 Tax=Zasmidium cellare TaxID=395010 RepID=A0ABR0EYN3_ZASCE|nr:hypothetical protein PRZ48_000050 [Zasmidium cellare]